MYQTTLLHPDFRHQNKGKMSINALHNNQTVKSLPWIAYYFTLQHTQVTADADTFIHIDCTTLPQCIQIWVATHQAGSNEDCESEANQHGRLRQLLHGGEASGKLSASRGNKCKHGQASIDHLWSGARERKNTA